MPPGRQRRQRADPGYRAWPGNLKPSEMTDSERRSEKRSRSA